MYDVARTGENPNESSINASSIANLSLAWTHSFPGPLESQPVVAFGHVYVNSWDGYEYAFNVSNGSQAWKTFIGQTTFSACGYAKARGTTSTPTIVNDTMYVLGGDPYLYAINATSGRIEWKVAETVNNPSGGDYNWGSVIVWKSSAYIGLSSPCNNPPSQGMVIQINLNGTNHSVQHQFAVVGAGVSGGGVWSTGSIDPAANILWITTGDEVSATSGYYRGIVALNATNLSLIGSWQEGTSGADYDFGAGPTLFHDGSGRPLVAATNKNGQVYALNRSNVSTPGWKPIWTDNVSWYDNASRHQLACGCALSPAAFDGNWLYLGGGYARLANGTNIAGSVRSVYPSNGTVRWTHVAPGIVRAGLTLAGGLLFDAADWASNKGSMVEALDPQNGTRVFGYTLNQTVNAPITVVQGHVFFVSANWNVSPPGHLVVLSIPLHTDATLPPGPVLVGAPVQYSERTHGGTAPYSSRWTFGDGSSSTVSGTVIHSYRRIGNFTGILTTTDASGVVAQFSWTTRVLPVAIAVNEFLATPNPASVGSPVALNATVLGGFGNLTFAYSGLPPGCNSFDTASYSCVPSESGNFSVTVSVIDEVGSRASDTIQLTVISAGTWSVRSFVAQPATLYLGSATWLNVSISGPSPPLSFSFGGLPAGCSSRNVSALACLPTRAGHFTVGVFVNDSLHNSGHAATSLDVLPPVGVIPLIVSLTAAPASIHLGAPVVITLTLGGESKRDSVGYTGLPTPCQSANSTQISCVPDMLGRYLIQATVTDLSGLHASSNTTLNVTPPNAPPGNGNPFGDAGGWLGSPFLWVGVAAVALLLGVATWVWLGRRPPPSPAPNRSV